MKAKILDETRPRGRDGRWPAATHLPRGRRINQYARSRPSPPSPEQTEVGSYFVANYPPFSVWTARRPSADAQRGPGGARRAGRAAGPLPAHPLLPEALPFLLLPRLHRQERARGRGVSRSARRASGSSTPQRRRSPAGRSTSSISAAARRRSCRRSSCRGWSARLNAQRRVERRRRDHVRVRARHAHRSEAGGDPRDGRHAPQPRRRELRRSHPRAERPRASLAGDRPRLSTQARALGFPQINIDLIAGMLGETEANWRDCIERTLALDARQRHHLPDGAALQHDDQRRPAEGRRAVRRSRSPTGRTKRRWVQEAFAALERAGLSRRQRLHRGQGSGDRRSSSIAIGCGKARTCVGLGVASFGHINGVHVQNLDTWPRRTRRRSSAARFRSAAPIGPTDEERLIREFVLQLKRGSIRPAYFAREVRRRRAARASRGAARLAAATATSPRPTPIASR